MAAGPLSLDAVEVGQGETAPLTKVVSHGGACLPIITMLYGLQYLGMLAIHAGMIAKTTGERRNFPDPLQKSCSPTQVFRL